MVISYYENALKLLQITTKWEQNHFPVTEKSISQGLGRKNLPEMQDPQRTMLDPSDRKRPWRRASQPTPVSCLENAIDGGDWWATVHGVSKSWI